MTVMTDTPNVHQHATGTNNQCTSEETNGRYEPLCSLARFIIQSMTTYVMERARSSI